MTILSVIERESRATRNRPIPLGFAYVPPPPPDRSSLLLAGGFLLLSLLSPSRHQLRSTSNSRANKNLIGRFLRSLLWLRGGGEEGRRERGREKDGEGKREREREGERKRRQDARASLEGWRDDNAKGRKENGGEKKRRNELEGRLFPRNTIGITYGVISVSNSYNRLNSFSRAAIRVGATCRGLPTSRFYFEARSQT